MQRSSVVAQGDRGFDGVTGSKGSQGEKGERVSIPTSLAPLLFKPNTADLSEKSYQMFHLKTSSACFL